MSITMGIHSFTLGWTSQWFDTIGVNCRAALHQVASKFLPCQPPGRIVSDIALALCSGAFYWRANGLKPEIGAHARDAFPI